MIYPLIYGDTDRRVALAREFILFIRFLYSQHLVSCLSAISHPSHAQSHILYLLHSFACTLPVYLSISFRTIPIYNDQNAQFDDTMCRRNESSSLLLFCWHGCAGAPFQKQSEISFTSEKCISLALLFC